MTRFTGAHSVQYLFIGISEFDITILNVVVYVTHHALQITVKHLMIWFLEKKKKKRTEPFLGHDRNPSTAATMFKL